MSFIRKAPNPDCAIASAREVDGAGRDVQTDEAGRDVPTYAYAEQEAGVRSSPSAQHLRHPRGAPRAVFDQDRKFQLRDVGRDADDHRDRARDFLWDEGMMETKYPV